MPGMLCYISKFYNLHHGYNIALLTQTPNHPAHYGQPLLEVPYGSSEHYLEAP